jgi:hypothetical protein
MKMLENFYIMSQWWVGFRYSHCRMETVYMAMT